MVKVGAINEAINILKLLPYGGAPETSLYLAYAYIAQWDYKKAIRPLKRFIKHKNISDYQLLVSLT
ncbi:MAG: hypothetical protein R2827_05465 [Bdellovibrionales bacterium]